MKVRNEALHLAWVLAATKMAGGACASPDQARVEAIPAWITQPLYSSTTHDTLLVWGVATAAFAADSSLVIGNGSDLISLSPDGHTLHRLGRQGDGPGEYRLILLVGKADDGTLFVAELSGRITHLTADGQVLGIIPRLRAGSSKREVDVIAMLDSGRIVATWWQQRPNRGDIAGLPDGDLERDPVPLLVYDSTGQPIDSLGLWRGLERALIPPGSRLPVPFARSAVYDANGSTIAIGPTDSIDVSVFDGVRPISQFSARAPTRIPTSADRAASSHAILLEYDSPELVAGLEAAPQVEAMPVVGALVVDDRRNIWVGDYVTPAEHERRWTVYSPAGRPIGTTLLPASPEALVPGRSEILDVYGDRLALLRESEEGELSIEVRQIHRDSVQEASTASE